MYKEGLKIKVTHYLLPGVLFSSSEHAHDWSHKLCCAWL